jgi:hypothetical protein
MSELHELLAVEGDRKEKYQNMLQEASDTFSKRVNHFQERTKVLRTWEEEVPEDERELVVERQDMTTTVRDKLDYLGQYIVDYFDVVLQKEMANQHAKADLTIDHDIFLLDAPATFLLGLESKLVRIRNVLKTIPTHKPGVEWEEDPNHRLAPNVVKTKNPVEAFQTKKTIEAKILFRPTKEDPPSAGPTQVEKVPVVQNTGKFIGQEWSGMISPAEKSQMLARCDKLIEATKTARMRANKEEVPSAHVGLKIWDYILGEKM